MVLLMDLDHHIVAIDHEEELVSSGVAVNWASDGGDH